MHIQSLMIEYTRSADGTRIAFERFVRIENPFAS